jgi:ubiquinone/menaquinone biosynthesis C-methylase UbiE
LTAVPFLRPGSRVLEVGFGPGHLLVDLVASGQRPIGLDPSKAMLRMARRRLLSRQFSVPLCRGLAEALPFAPQSFDAIVSTFPTSYVYDVDWLLQAFSVLRAGGLLVIVEMASFDAATPLSQSAEWLFGITGQRAPAPDLVGLLRQAGLPARRESVQVENSVVGLVVAEKCREVFSEGSERA